MAFLNRFKRNKEDPEVARRALLLRAGRITDGIVLDLTSDDAAIINRIFFTYQINGVEYESSQALNNEQREQQANYAPGARVIIRYDPQRPANSIVV